MIIKKLPVMDLNHLRNCVNEPPFGVDTRLDVNCPNCSAEFEAELPLEASFFFPKRKKGETQA